MANCKLMLIISVTNECLNIIVNKQSAVIIVYMIQLCMVNDTRLKPNKNKTELE